MQRRRWVDDDTFSELLALSNVLPGPSSSQLGIAVLQALIFIGLAVVMFDFKMTGDVLSMLVMVAVPV